MKKILKRILFTLLSLVLVVVLIAVGYVAYILLSYSRIGSMELDITRNSDKSFVEVDQTYSISTYNIGFGAYSPDFT